MPKNNVDNLITDQEIAFDRLVLSGTMTDRQAAEAVGLNPDTASYSKSKPRVHAYMPEHRAAVEQQLVEQEAQELHRCSLVRDRVLARLWQIADMDPEMTRNSASSQVKALSMIVAIEGLIPDRHSARRAVSAENKPAPPPVNPPFYVSEWMRTKKDGESADPQPPSAPEQQDDKQEAAPEPQSAPGSTDEPPRPTHDPTLDVTESTFFAGPLNPSQTTSSAPRVPMADYVAPDTRRPFSRDNRFGRRR
jgi:hypothetical protein